MIRPEPRRHLRLFLESLGLPLAQAGDEIRLQHFGDSAAVRGRALGLFLGLLVTRFGLSALVTRLAQLGVELIKLLLAYRSADAGFHQIVLRSEGLNLLIGVL